MTVQKFWGLDFRTNGSRDYYYISRGLTLSTRLGPETPGHEPDPSFPPWVVSHKLNMILQGGIQEDDTDLRLRIRGWDKWHDPGEAQETTLSLIKLTGFRGGPNQ